MLVSLTHRIQLRHADGINKCRRAVQFRVHPAAPGHMEFLERLKILNTPLMSIRSNFDNAFILCMSSVPS